jgi:hypothetical protein
MELEKLQKITEKHKQLVSEKTSELIVKEIKKKTKKDRYKDKNQILTIQDIQKDRHM